MHKQVVWSIIVITAWLSLVIAVWLVTFQLINPWMIVYWSAMSLLALAFGAEKNDSR